MLSEFDTDTAVRSATDGRYDATISERWDIVGVPNGGYSLAVVVRALAEELPQPDPLTVTGHFLRPAAHGAAEIAVGVVRAGRTTATGQATLAQDGRPRLQVLAAFGDLSARHGPTHLSDGPPQLPPPDDCTDLRGKLAREMGALTDRLDMRFPAGTPGWAHDEPSGSARLSAWLRLADGRPPDVLALPLLVDCFPPPIFELGVQGWIPTIELTCHVRARPAPGWLRCAVRTRFVQDGLLDEEIEVWDSNDRLVALARQLALVPPTDDS
ncbi:thioesterase family protein [soil metagenome]